MKRYIDADALGIGKADRNAFTIPEFADGWNGAIEIIANAPTADVVEVRHGTWYHGTENGAVYAKCSACGRKMNYSCYGYAYCSLCGAKMDGERREENEG